MLSYTKPVAVELLVFKGVGGCGWPILFRMWRMGMAVVALWKIPATSASAEDETTCCRVLHSTKIAPFNFGRFVLLGWSDMWKYPATQLRAFGATRYAASLLMWRTMLLAWYCMYALGYV